jgi:hypothetical protein
MPDLEQTKNPSKFSASPVTFSLLGNAETQNLTTNAQTLDYLENQLLDMNHKVDQITQYYTFTSPNSSSQADYKYRGTQNFDDWTSQIDEVLARGFGVYIFLLPEMSQANTGILPEIIAGNFDNISLQIAKKYKEQVKKGLVSFNLMSEWEQENTSTVDHFYNIASTRTSNGATILARIANFKIAFDRIAKIFYDEIGVACVDLSFSSRSRFYTLQAAYVTLGDLIPNQKYIRIIGNSNHTKGNSVTSTVEKDRPTLTFSNTTYQAIKPRWGGGFGVIETGVHIQNNTVDEVCAIYESQKYWCQYIPALKQYNDFLVNKPSEGFVTYLNSKDNEAILKKYREARSLMKQGKHPSTQAKNLFDLNLIKKTVTGSTETIVTADGSTTATYLPTGSSSKRFLRYNNSGTNTNKGIDLRFPKGFFKKNQTYTLVIPVRGIFANSAGTGTVSTTANSTTITGTGTAFLAEFNPTTSFRDGSTMQIAGVDYVVDQITSNTSLTVLTAPTSSSTGQAIKRYYNGEGLIQYFCQAILTTGYNSVQDVSYRKDLSTGWEEMIIHWHNTTTGTDLGCGVVNLNWGFTTYTQPIFDVDIDIDNIKITQGINLNIEASSQNKVANEVVLSSTSSISGLATTGTTTTLFTPTQSCKVTKVRVSVQSLAGTNTANPVFSIGTNATSYDNILANTSFDGVLSFHANGYAVFDVSSSYQQTNPIIAKLVTPATGNTAINYTVELLGYLI